MDKENKVHAPLHRAEIGVLTEWPPLLIRLYSPPERDEITSDELDEMEGARVRREVGE